MKTFLSGIFNWKQIKMNNTPEKNRYHLWEEDDTDAEPEEDSIWIRRTDIGKPDRSIAKRSPPSRWISHVRNNSRDEMPLNPRDLQQTSPHSRNHIGEDTLYNGDHKSHSVVDSPKSESGSQKTAMDRRHERESIIMAQIRLRKISQGNRPLAEFDEPKDEIDPGDDKASFFAKVSPLQLWCRKSPQFCSQFHIPQLAWQIDPIIVAISLQLDLIQKSLKDKKVKLRSHLCTWYTWTLSIEYHHLKSLLCLYNYVHTKTSAIKSTSRLLCFDFRSDYRFIIVLSWTRLFTDGLLQLKQKAMLFLCALMRKIYHMTQKRPPRKLNGSYLPCRAVAATLLWEFRISDPTQFDFIIAPKITSLTWCTI